jgi:hypothetical protein
MKCSICGTESKADARQCANCGATLVAPAPDQTMLDLRTAVYRRPPIVPGAPAAGSPPPSAAPPPTGGQSPARSDATGLALVLIALGVIGYFVYQVATTFDWTSRIVAPEPQIHPSKPAEPAPAVLPPVTAPPVAAAPASAAAEVPPAAEPRVATDPAPAVVPAAAPPPAATERTLAAPSLPMTNSAPDAAPVPSAGQEPSRPDRWRQMSDALAGCVRENLIGRIVCEQRVNLQYCNGYWGKVPQCPDTNNPDRGR